jgi:hypothetical protein
MDDDQAGVSADRNQHRSESDYESGALTAELRAQVVYLQQLNWHSGKLPYASFEAPFQ